MKRRTKNDQASLERSAQARERRTVSGLRAAFTLIELLVVMVVAAVIMAVSLPSFLSMGRGAGMRTAVNNVRSTIALSRQWAITHREPITFVASTTGLVYNATNNPPFSQTTNDHACYYAVSAVSTALIQSITDLPLDVTFLDDSSASATNLTFKTDGGLDGNVGLPRNIVLVDKRNPTDLNKRRTISINVLTGGIKVQ
ncbi:MAG: GspH/FimT family pseudopilin [Kiritimatiellia bacterium]|jgi:prepilin-type N-terminal cleavage/methylation domain-containing protein